MFIQILRHCESLCLNQAVHCRFYPSSGKMFNSSDSFFHLTLNVCSGERFPTINQPQICTHKIPLSFHCIKKIAAFSNSLLVTQASISSNILMNFLCILSSPITSFRWYCNLNCTRTSSCGPIKVVTVTCQLLHAMLSQWRKITHLAASPPWLLLLSLSKTCRPRPCIPMYSKALPSLLHVQPLPFPKASLWALNPICHQPAYFTKLPKSSCSPRLSTSPSKFCVSHKLWILTREQLSLNHKYDLNRR